MKYVGTIGDVRHFKIKGQKGFFAGMVGGPTAEQVKTAPEFERTRENLTRERPPFSWPAPRPQLVLLVLLAKLELSSHGSKSCFSKLLFFCFCCITQYVLSLA